MISRDLGHFAASEYLARLSERHRTVSMLNPGVPIGIPRMFPSLQTQVLIECYAAPVWEFDFDALLSTLARFVIQEQLDAELRTVTGAP
jgi:hypothetical protein